MLKDNEGTRPHRGAESVELETLLRSLGLPRELSHREAQTVAAGLRGLHTKETATELGLSPKTVDEMWRRVYRKFGVGCDSRLQVLSRLFWLVARGA